MKKEVLTFKMPQVKTRSHYILFAENSPFKAKAMRRKDRYQRKDKHVNRQDWD